MRAACLVKMIPYLAQITSCSSMTMSWIEILALMLIPGAFGGILSVLQLIDVPRLMDSAKLSVFVSRRRFYLALILGAFGGCGGALAILLLGLWTKQLDDNLVATTRNKLLFCSLGVVSGFLGFRLLKSVASNLEKQIHDAELRAEDRIREMEKRLVEEDDIMSQAREAFRSKTVANADIEQVISAMEQVKRRRPADRTVAILIGNLYDKVGKHTEAISAVTDTLAAKGRLGKAADKDAADMLFNRACYRIPLFAAAENDEAKKNVLKKEILEDLKTSFSYFPENKVIARGDEDLAALKNDPDFRALVDG